jgi:hypothetical protein
MARLVQVALAGNTAEAEQLRELLQSAGIDSEIVAEGEGRSADRARPGRLAMRG